MNQNNYRSSENQNANGRRPVPPVAPEGMPPAYPGDNKPETPIAPGGGNPAYPGDNKPETPIAPGGGNPVYPGNNIPETPIAPGGGNPVYPGDNIPETPIAPGGGNPVYPGDNIPETPIAPGGGYPVYPGDNIPVTPIAPGGGMPAAPGPNYPFPPSGPGVIIPIIPGNQNAASVRFFHGAINAGSVMITIGSQTISNNLRYSQATNYQRVNDGFRTVTISTVRAPRTVVYRESMPFVAGMQVTLAIINSSKGIDVMQIPDMSCFNRPRNLGCFRVANLSYNSPPLEVLLYDGRMVFSDVRFKEVTSFKQARPAEYAFYLANTPHRPMPLGNDMNSEVIGDRSRYVYDTKELEPLLSFLVDIEANTMYTAYIIGNNGYAPPLQVVVLENK